MKMDAISERGVGGSGKFHTTIGEALKRSFVRTAGNSHLCGDQNAAAT